MKNFETFLRDDIWQPEGVLDDDMPEAFEKWLVSQDFDELIKSADEYGQVCFFEGKEKIKKEIEKMKITPNSHPFHANFEPVKGHIIGYNEAISEIINLIQAKKINI